jgi:serine/threonine-protein kinase
LVLPEGFPCIIGGKYRLLDVLGTGATGTVYSVEHTFTGEALALKVMRGHPEATADAVARFKREAQAVSRIRSEHVVRIFDADLAPELGRVPYLVMDLLEGIDLEHLAGDQPVKPEAVVDWLGQVAFALEKAHAVGIVHRDLKPENLFLTRREDGSPLIKVLDFGIAKLAAESTTQSGQIFGTPLYMAPEQARGDSTQVGPAADTCAVGLIAYRLLTGSDYRTQTGLTGILNEILHEPLQAPSERGHALGPEFDRWFMRSCDPDPARRFASAREQVEALAVALGRPIDLDRPRVPPSSRRGRPPLPGESQSPQSYSICNALVDPRETQTTQPARFRQGATLGAAPGGTTARTGGALRRQRRRAIVVLGAVGAVALLTLTALRGSVRSTGIAAAARSTCPGDSATVARSPTASVSGPAGSEPPGSSSVAAPPFPSSSSLHSPVAPAAGSPVGPRSAATPAPVTERTFFRAAVLRAGPPRVGLTRSRSLAEEDPLGDQK